MNACNKLLTDNLQNKNCSEK